MGHSRFTFEYFLLTGLAVIVLAYTVFLLFLSVEVYYDWINNLLATMLSALAGFLSAFILYRLQVKRSDEKRLRELTDLVLGEIEEVRKNLKDSNTNVPKEALEEFGSVPMANISLFVHYPNSVLIQDAARSGLFDLEQTRLLMRLVQDMDTHIRFMDHASNLEPALEESAASATIHPKSKAGRWAKGMLRRYAQTVRMVQQSEESILGRCEDIEKALERSE